MSLASIRAGLASNLGTIAGLRVSEFVPDSPNPPVAVIGLQNILYDRTMSNGLTQYNFTVQVIVGRASERAAQRKLDEYVVPTGASSVKAAIQLDRTLGGAAQDAYVESMPNVGSLQVNDQEYLAADFLVAIYG